MKTYSRLLLAFLLLILIAPPVAGDDAGKSDRQKQADLQLLNAARNPETKSNEIQALLDAGANPNARHREGMTPLLYAAKNIKNPKVHTILLEAGARVDSRNGDGYTSLMLASGGSTSRVVKVLLSAGADVNAQRIPSTYGATALMDASDNWRNPDIVSLLIDSGADVNAKTAKVTRRSRAMRPRLVGSLEMNCPFSTHLKIFATYFYAVFELDF